MKIFCDAAAPHNSTDSFRLLSNEINRALGEIGHLGTKEDCDFYVWSTSCDVHVRHPRAKTVLNLSWETSTPLERIARQLKNVSVLGVSQQVCDTYAAAGIKMDYVHLGIDPKAWYPSESGEKFEKTTVLIHTSSNTRSGLECALPAWGKAFEGRKDIRLILKDRPGGKVQELVDRINLIYDTDIIYDARDLTKEGLRELYQKSHYGCYPTNGGSFCLTCPELMACGTPLLATSCDTLKEYHSEDFGLFINCNFAPFNREYVEKCAKVGISNSMETENYVGIPHLWYPRFDDLVRKFKMAEEEIKSGVAAKKGAAAAEFVKLNLQWKQTALKLVEKLSKL